MSTTRIAHNGRTISLENLQHMIDRSIKFTLIDLLDAASFGEFHLPGAINIPLNEQFAASVAAAVPEKDGKIVVYCADQASDVSARATEQLMALGYTRVRDFEDGRKGWREAPAAPATPAAAPAPAPGAARRAVATARPSAVRAPSAT